MFNTKKIKELQAEIDMIKSRVVEDFNTKQLHFKENMVAIEIKVTKDVYNSDKIRFWKTECPSNIEQCAYFLKGTEPKCDLLNMHYDYHGRKKEIRYIKNNVECDKDGNIKKLEISK